MSSARPFLTAEWRNLALLNFEADPQTLHPWLPPGTELDFFEGRTFVSLVGFRFLNTRIAGIPIPFHRNFEEVNLRFYVRFRGPEGWRRGVAFVRELVPRRAIAWVAQRRYNEPYLAIPMASEAPEGLPGVVAYRWKVSDAWMGLRMAVGAEADVSDEAGFIAEHFWGYGRSENGQLIQYRVEHPTWRLFRADHVALEGPVPSFYGSPFAEIIAGPPRSSFCADGSAVSVSLPELM